MQIQNGAPLTCHLFTPKIQPKQVPGTEFSCHFAKEKCLISSESDIQPSSQSHHVKTNTLQKPIKTLQKPENPADCYTTEKFAELSKTAKVGSN